MADIPFDTLEDVAAFVAALPSEARDLSVAQDIHRGGKIIGHRVHVPDQWRTEAEVLAADMPGVRRQELIQHAKDCRWRAETGGMVWRGVRIMTDDRSQLKVAGARIAASDPEFSLTWWAEGDTSVDLDSAGIIDLADAVQAHVSSVFRVYGDVHSKILSGHITTRGEIEAEPWPGK
jgi:hypothetical protein